MDYLKELGVDHLVDACLPSPQADFGYDISTTEHRSAICTLATLTAGAEAGKRHIRIVMDMVMNTRRISTNGL